MFIDLKRSIFGWISIEYRINPNSFLSSSFHSFHASRLIFQFIDSFSEVWLNFDRNCYVFARWSKSSKIPPLLDLVFRSVHFTYIFSRVAFRLPHNLLLLAYIVCFVELNATDQTNNSQSNKHRERSRCAQIHTRTHSLSLSDSINNAFSCNVFFFFLRLHSFFWNPFLHCCVSKTMRYQSECILLVCACANISIWKNVERIEIWMQ